MTKETADQNLWGFFTLRSRRCQVIDVTTFGGFVHYGFQTVDNENRENIIGWIPADLIGDLKFMNKINWTIQQKHENDIKTLLKETGCLNSKNQLTRWKTGTWTKLNSLGHTSLDVETCNCSKP